jgi:hypothetical protein
MRYDNKNTLFYLPLGHISFTQQYEDVCSWFLHLVMLNNKYIYYARTSSQCCMPTLQALSKYQDRFFSFVQLPSRYTQDWRYRCLLAILAGLACDTTLHSHLPDITWNFLLIIILWKIRDTHNTKVFCQHDHPCNKTIRNIIYDLTLCVGV